MSGKISSKDAALIYQNIGVFKCNNKALKSGDLSKNTESLLTFQAKKSRYLTILCAALLIVATIIALSFAHSLIDTILNPSLGIKLLESSGLAILSIITCRAIYKSASKTNENLKHIISTVAEYTNQT